MKSFNCLLALLGVFCSFNSCQSFDSQKSEHDSYESIVQSKVDCLSKIISTHSENAENKMILEAFQDTLAKWKSIINPQVVSRYNIIVDGLISFDEGEQGMIYVLDQRKYRGSGSDHVKQILFKKIDEDMWFYPYGIMSMSFSRYMDESPEDPISIRNLQSLYRESLVLNYGILDENECVISDTYIEDWTKNVDYHSKYIKWLNSNEKYW